VATTDRGAGGEVREKLAQGEGISVGTNIAWLLLSSIRELQAMFSRQPIALINRRPNRRPAAAIGPVAGLSHEPGVGAHLVTSRRGYTHHGIYVGNGMVVHYAGLSRRLRRGPVEEVTMSRFSMGRQVGIMQDRDSSYSPQEIVLRARSRLGEDTYHVLRNNCEHFCNWCISGRSRSIQVERPGAIPLRALVAAARCADRLPLMLRSLHTMVSRAAPAG